MEGLDHASVLAFAKAFGISIGCMGTALGQGRLVAKALEAIGRNPEVSGKIIGPMLLGAALCETSAIYSILVVFTLQ